ncbi:MAG: hypothetical protein JWM33_2950 [Caulobacteraceae bacterium]|nr:hypothetical protein [Caulobacteraceae bacterium]
MRGMTVATVPLLLLAGIVISTGPALAADDPGPSSLPGRVIGVVGSGDKLSLRIKTDEAPRTLDIGDVYQDGWRLTALTNTTATLTKDDRSEAVGLNLEGSLGPQKSADSASTVNTVGTGAITVAKLQLGLEAFTQLIAAQVGPWDGKTPKMGLSLAETQRYVDYQKRGAQYPDQSMAPPPNGFLSVGQVTSLGEDVDDYLALNQKLLDALNAERGYTPDIHRPPGQSGPPPPAQTLQLANQYALESTLATIPGNIN